MISNLKLKIENYQSSLYSLIILFLPTQLGLHFWPEYSKVLGIRIDYLSPTFYFTDVLTGLLFLMFMFSSLRRTQVPKQSQIKTNRLFRFTRNDIMIIIFVLTLLTGIYFSKVPQLGLYGIIKLLELLFFGYYTAFQFKLNFKRLIILFSIGILLESLLAVAQYLNQGSLQGIFYWLGERLFNPQTPGIANANLNGILVLRPYGTFSHPNVLAGYLLIGLQFLLANEHFSVIVRNPSWRMTKQSLALAMIITLGSIALFLTMSRVAILLYVFVFLNWVLINLRKRIYKYFMIGLFIYLLIGSFFLTFFPRFNQLTISDESVTQRSKLNIAAIEMFKNHPLFGVGMNNFLVNLPTALPLQPVHNIYLLVLAETGLVGLGFFIWFIYRTIQNSKFKIQNYSSKLESEKEFYKHALLCLFIILIIGFFDHYFLTLQQGQLLSSFIFGLCYNKRKE